MQSQAFHTDFWSIYVTQVGVRNMFCLLYFAKVLLGFSTTEGVLVAGFYVGSMLLKFWYIVALGGGGLFVF